jgi:hypothetical protein
MTQLIFYDRGWTSVIFVLLKLYDLFKSFTCRWYEHIVILSYLFRIARSFRRIVERNFIKKIVFLLSFIPQ